MMSRERQNKKSDRGCQYLEAETSNINGLSHYSKTHIGEYAKNTT